jgi:putative protease
MTSEPARLRPAPTASGELLCPFAPAPRPELLAPAGDWDCIRAAVENGADSVYFGLDIGFNARARAANFPLDDLPRLFDYLHRRGVRGYVTLNTLIFTSELAAFEDAARRIAQAAADAAIVQDLGAIKLLRALCPDLPIHASTQTTMTSAENIRELESLGVERVILARELSIREIAKIRRHTALALEVFVHGALCVAYSGQCLTSESLGGRSANRGQCAQACRLPYEMVCDGKHRDLGLKKYLLSPQDLAAYDLLPELIAAGVSCFKIEGRLKTAEYVANITAHYRRAIDAALAGRPLGMTAADVQEMELSFSRGFSHGWLEGCNHPALVPARSSTKRGIRVGTVVSVRRGRVLVELSGPIKRGDGVVFETGGPQDDEPGGRVYEVFAHGDSLTGTVATGSVELAFRHGEFDLRRLAAGHMVWKTDDPHLTRRLRATFKEDAHTRRVKLDLQVQAVAGQVLRVIGRAENGATCDARSPQPLPVAQRHPLTQEMLVEQLGRLGGTCYVLQNLWARIEGPPMVPLSILGRLRHAIVAQLDASLPVPPRRVAEQPVLPKLRAAVRIDEDAATSRGASAAGQPILHVLCRTLEQLHAALAAGARELYADFQDIRQYRAAVAEARAANTSIWLATPRIQKPDELGIFRVLLRHGSDGILVRNLAGLAYYSHRQVPSIADFSLNAANELTVGLLRERGAVRVTASYDLNREQLLELVGATPAAALEVVVHQHMPMFHMEHCVFCAVLSPGTNKTNCGRPCDTHAVHLRDRLGVDHPLRADVGCRNTLFNAVPQSGAEAAPQLIERGVRHFRIELLDESPADIARLIGLYGQLLAGRVPGREVWTALNASNRVGVTRGTLEERRNPLAIL